MSNQTALLLIICLGFGWALGLWMGWAVWRRPMLAYTNPRQLGTCVTGAQACDECLLGDGFCRKEVSR